MSSRQTAALANTCNHIHVYDDRNPLAESRMRIVVALTVVMMVIEIGAGWLLHSMALLADGWHMSSHALALGLAAAAYALARRLAADERFAFGTWKIEVLGGYTSALFLVMVAAYMVYESAVRLSHPAPIAYNQAIGIALVGLLVNIVSAWLLGDAAHHHDHGGHEHEHDHDHAHEHGHGEVRAHQDLNLRSAYVHVAADAATSVLAIGALSGGKYLGLTWLDPVMGFIGGAVVAAWAAGLLRDTGRVLLDAEMDAPVVNEIRQAVRESHIPAVIQDLHVWRVGRRKYACLLCVATDVRATADDFRNMLAVHEELVHLSLIHI